jgi:hypothetical protein
VTSQTPSKGSASMDDRPAIEVIHADGSRTRYEADHDIGWFVLVTKSERLRVAPADLEEELRSQMWRMAFGRRRS